MFVDSRNVNTFRLDVRDHFLTHNVAVLILKKTLINKTVYFFLIRACFSSPLFLLFVSLFRRMSEWRESLCGWSWTMVCRATYYVSMATISKWTDFINPKIE